MMSQMDPSNTDQELQSSAYVGYEEQPRPGYPHEPYQVPPIGHARFQQSSIQDFGERISPRTNSASPGQRLALAIVSLGVLLILVTSLFGNKAINPFVSLVALVIVATAAILINFLFSRQS